MRIMGLLTKENIILDLKADSKKSVLEELVDRLVISGCVSNAKNMVEQLLEREALGSTGIGQGLAIPHAKSGSAKMTAIALGISKSGIPFESLDGAPAHIFFLLVAPEENAGEQLKAMSRISQLLRDKHLRRRLIEAASVDDVVSAIEEKDHFAQIGVR